MSSLITLSWSFTGLSLMLRMRIKQIGSSNSGEDFSRGFSYIISSRLIEEGRKPTVMISYIATFCPNSLKKYVLNGGLPQHFIGIAILTRFGEAC